LFLVDKAALAQRGSRGLLENIVIRHDGRGLAELVGRSMSVLPKRALVRTLWRHYGAVSASRLGRGLTITGELYTEEDLHIYGRVLGTVCADRIVIALGSDVEGDIVAHDAQISGRVLGRIFAVNVRLDSSAEVTGRIFHHIVKVAPGARIDGRMPWRPVNFFRNTRTTPGDPAMTMFLHNNKAPEPAPAS
jgi:cytoskeletal protein CcmA (bactofilin family)